MVTSQLSDFRFCDRSVKSMTNNLNALMQMKAIRFISVCFASLKLKIGNDLFWRSWTTGLEMDIKYQIQLSLQVLLSL